MNCLGLTGFIVSPLFFFFSFYAAEVQVKRISSSSSDGEEDEDARHVDEDDEMGDESQRLERHCLPALQCLQLSDDSGAEVDASPSPTPLPPAVSTPPPAAPVSSDVMDSPADLSDEAVPDNSPWLLSQEMLQDGLRVLIAEEGLFRIGSVTGIRPPDIYGVVVDGERGSRPRILPTEELLNDAVRKF